MSVPIQEPGPTTRTDAKLTWGMNQLFRRPAPRLSGELPWIVLKDVGTGQEFPEDDDTVIVYDCEINYYPDTFDSSDFGPDLANVLILEDGVYSMHGNLPMDELNIVEHTIDIITVDVGPVTPSSPQFARTTAQLAHSATGPNVSGADTWGITTRLGAGQIIRSIFNNPAPATAYHSRDDGGAYFEVVKLGSATMEGRDRDTCEGT